MKRILLFLLSVLISLPLAAGAESSFDLADSVLRLDTYAADGTYEGSGSGFVAFDSLHIVTAMHLVFPDDVAYVIASDSAGNSWKTDLVSAFDKRRDIAVLELSESTQLVPLSLSVDSPCLGMPIIAMGYPAGESASSVGSINSISRFRIFFTAPVAGGSSGGPLLNESGGVIGVVTNKRDDGIGVATAITDVERIYTDAPAITIKELQDTMGGILLQP